MPRRNLLVLLVVAASSWLCYERASRNRYAATLAEAMNIVTTRYIDEVEPRVLFEGAMDGMVGKLDSYSAYTSPEEFDQFRQQMDGSITGIGIMVEAEAETGRLVVLEALVGKPAYLAGIRPGDAILAIDGQPTKGLALRDAVKLIRGRTGTKVRVLIQHADREQAVEHELERTTIPVESVMGDVRQADGQWSFRLADHPQLGYIRLTSFGERTGEEFRAALAALRQGSEPLEGLILDLRYNPGGLLSAATEVCDAFLDGGLIVTTRGRGGVLLEQHAAQPGVEVPADLPVVVLVDRLSASASEIVAACLQDHGRAVVAGQRSWGKGTVQNVIALEGGRSAIRLTIGSYHRPSGKEIHKWKTSTEADDWGVRPDPGLDVPLTNRQNDLIIQCRRKRDLLSWEELQQAKSAPPPAPRPPSKPLPEQASDERAAIEAQAAARAAEDPAAVDPQLARAVEHLERPAQTGGRARSGK